MAETSTRCVLMLLYGESDVGKTAQLGRLAKYHFDRTGEISRLVSADSGWDSIDPALIWSAINPSGIIEPWNVSGLKDPWCPLVKVTEGEWPLVVIGSDGKPRKRMQQGTFKDGRIVGSEGRIVGQYFFEGLSTLGNVGLLDHVRTQRVFGQDVVGKFTSTEETIDAAGKVATTSSMIFAKAAPSHYQQVQDYLLLDLVPRTGSMPVARVVWTAHEAKGKDELTGIENSVLGPATVGKATVDKTVQKFAHSFHLTSETSFSGEKAAQKITRTFRAWFVKHPDMVLTRMTWPTKVSLDIGKSQELLKKFPGGFIPLTNDGGVEMFFEFLRQ